MFWRQHIHFGVVNPLKKEWKKFFFMILIVRVNGDNWGLTEDNLKWLDIRDFETFPRNRRKEVVAKISIFANSLTSLES